MELVTKSRHLPLSDFYSILQLEYISYFVRSKIYPPEYAAKYSRYCDCKREKIDKIGDKNELPSIFNGEAVKNRYVDVFLNAYGLPNFEYRDENSVRIMGKWDRTYWFREGTRIKVRSDSELVHTVIVKNLVNIESVIVNINRKPEQFGYDFITRIISDKLLDF